MTEIKDIAKETRTWPKEKCLRFAGLCGQYSRGIYLEPAMIKAYKEMEKENDVEPKGKITGKNRK